MCGAAPDVPAPPHTAPAVSGASVEQERVHTTDARRAAMVPNTVGENVQLEVYETESSEWHKFDCLQRFRHTIWAVDSTIFMHGGFEKETPNIPTNSIVKIDLMTLFQYLPHLKSKLENSIGAANRKKNNANGGAAEATDGREGRRTPPMQSLARD